MPTIPDGQRIARRTPSGQQAIVREDTRFAGAVMGAVADIASGVLNRRTNFQVAQAQAEFLTSKVEQDNAFDQDPEYQTIPDRYTEGLGKGLDKAAAIIQDPNARASFMQGAQVRVAEGRERIEGLAWRKEVDHQRAYLDEKLVVLRESGITGNAIDAMMAVQDLVTAGVSAGYIPTEVEGGDIIRQWREGMVLGKLEAMNPTERLEALDAPFARNLPTDTVEVIRRGATSELASISRALRTEQVQQFAVDTVDEMVGAGVTPDEAALMFPRIIDATERLAVEYRYNNEWNRQQKIASRELTDLYDDTYAQVRRGDLLVADIPPLQMEMLKAETGKLLDAESQAAAGRAVKVSDPETVRILFRGLADSEVDAVKLDEAYRESAGLLTPSDWSMFGKAIAGRLNEEEELLLSALQIINARVTRAFSEVKMDTSEARAVRSIRINSQIADVQLNTTEWVRNQTALKGTPPTEGEVNDHIDNQFTNMVYQEGRVIRFWPDTPELAKPWVMMDLEERDAAVRIIKDTDPYTYQGVLNVLGVGEVTEVNADDFMDAYNYVYGGGTTEFTDATFEAWEAANAP